MFERTVDLLSEFVDVDPSDISEDTALVDDLGLSSLDVIKIVSAFEDEFDVEIPDRIIPTFRTVGDVVKFLEENAE